MDLSLVFLFLMAAVVAAVLTARAAAGKAPKSNPRGVAFAVSFVLAMLLSRPWAALTTSEWKEFAVVTFFIIAWVAFGTVAGAAVGNKVKKGG